MSAKTWLRWGRPDSPAGVLLVLIFVVLWLAAVSEHLQVWMATNRSALGLVRALDGAAEQGRSVWAIADSVIVPARTPLATGDASDPALLRPRLALLTRIASNTSAEAFTHIKETGLACTDSLCRYLAGKAAFESGDLRAAKDYWADSQLPRFILAMSRELPAQEPGDRGLAVLTVLAESFSDSPQVLKEVGVRYMGYEMWTRALNAFERVYELNPREPRIGCYYGMALARVRGEYALGAELCSRTISREPNDMWLYQMISDMHVQAGDILGAQAWLGRAVLRFPHQSEPAAWLASLDSQGEGSKREQ